MGDKDKVHVKVQGTVVDGSTHEIGDDYEEWEGLQDVQINIGEHVMTYSDFWGNFKVNDVVNAGATLTINFRKSIFAHKSIGISVNADTKKQDVDLFVILSPSTSIT